MNDHVLHGLDAARRVAWAKYYEEKAERELLERQFQELLEGGRAWQYAAYTLAATVVRMERDAGVDDPYKLLEDWAKRWQEEGDDLESWVAALIREMLDNGIKKPMRLKAV